jgi:two-component system sensor histidine kinase DesK
VLRHAGASRVRVRVAAGHLSIADDGRGRGAGEGNGVRGMRERAAASGARFRLEDEPAGGTVVEVTW